MAARLEQDAKRPPDKRGTRPRVSAKSRLGEDINLLKLPDGRLVVTVGFKREEIEESKFPLAELSDMNSEVCNLRDQEERILASLTRRLIEIESAAVTGARGSGTSSAAAVDAMRLPAIAPAALWSEAVESLGRSARLLKDLAELADEAIARISARGDRIDRIQKETRALLNAFVALGGGYLSKDEPATRKIEELAGFGNISARAKVCRCRPCGRLESFSSTSWPSRDRSNH
jgi:hypothetical protein